MECVTNCKPSFLQQAGYYTDSLFNNPLGTYLHPVEKVAHVAFHVLTLGVPLAVYHIVRVASRLFEKAYDIINSPSPQFCDAISKKAVEFALAELKKHPNITPYPFCGAWKRSKETNQPVNPQIARLNTLFWAVAHRQFEAAIIANKENPWESKDVIDAADAMIKIGYTISKMTLEDLPEFVKELENKKNEKRTFAEALTKQDSYQYRTFYNATLSYHWARGALGYGVNPHRIDKITANDELDYLSSKIPEKHAKLFYQNGTIQNEWRTLYNEYCRAVRKVVPEKDLQRADNRHVSWTMEDRRPKTFYQVPDQLPT